MEKYWPHIRKNWYCFLLSPLFMTLEASGEFILPFMNANIIDRGAASGDIPYILRNGFYMAVIAGAMLACGVLGAFFAIRGSARMAAGVRRDAFARIQTFSFSDIDRFSTGSLITRVTNDITQIQNFAQTLMRGFFRSPVMLVGALIMSFRLNPRIALVILIVLPFLALATFWIIRTASPRYTVMQEQIDALNTGIGETVTNEKVIKSFVREDYEKKKFRALNGALMAKTVSALKMMILMQPVSALAINVTTLIVVWVAGRQIIVGNMEIGALTAFITYLSQVLTALNFLANIFLQGTRAGASHRRIGEVLRCRPDISDENAAHTDHKIRSGRIEFRRVSFRYFKDSPVPVLDDISVTIESGELVGIVGSTGSGKSTLVSMIPRLYDPDAGSVLVDGVDVRELSLFELRESVAAVLQKNTLFSGTIAENLRWGDENAAQRDLERVCKIAQADGFIRSFPQGYETPVGQGGGSLSGGQKQRLCIARALLKQPRILILDDSTSAVDTATDAAIRREFRRQLPDVTKLIIAQRISSVMDADKIIVMEQGRVVACGAHEELIRSCRAYQEIYDSQKEDRI
ncbi:MAG TPA: ABC transporter ATP-binding protein/permease [Candidatus Eisenbergiella merdigallinarum]|mgnify:CR=1 FL=1|uniref:ABC transporter ATP-binding protein/permease n=1 Tax=Candidatus Eisenbergiella merdigallinarum TaxID=2838552 RepID=A0A9D2SBY1_9FIRM|nr:ABC transporter ATP-binding protein/permease [Candidatus Eisenbergiella merdigallinarum]